MNLLRSGAAFNNDQPDLWPSSARGCLDDAAPAAAITYGVRLVLAVDRPWNKYLAAAYALERTIPKRKR